MAPRKNSFRTRASSILRSPLTTIHQGQLHDPSREERLSHSSHSPTNVSLNEKQSGLERTQTSSSGENTSQSPGGLNFGHDRDVQRVVRTIPAWVYVPAAGDVNLALRSQRLLSPAGAHVAQHNCSPSFNDKQILLSEGVKEHEAHWSPPWPGATPVQSGSRWRAFANATAYPRLYTDGEEIVSEEWLHQNGPDYHQPWLTGHEDGDEENGTASLFRSRIKRRAWYLRLQRTILRSPIVPMVIRMIVFGFSVVALGLATSIHHMTDLQGNPAPSTPSTDMAIIVDAVALVYLLYITYDEYSGKPLGLRSAKAKMRLIFLDLFFIVFDSANLSLAFDAVRNTDCSKINDSTCEREQLQLFHDVLLRQKALASVLLIALIAWLSTFSISIARVCGSAQEQPKNLRYTKSLARLIIDQCPPIMRALSGVKKTLSNMASSTALLAPLKEIKVSSHQIPAFENMPNTSIQNKPLLIYHGAFRSNTSATIIERHLSDIGVVEAEWRYSMYTFSHFHSTSHEVLCVYSGSAKLCFGGEDNPQRVEIVVGKGDVMVVPAGVAHRLLEDHDGGFSMVGCYPKGKRWDMCYGREGEEGNEKRIAMLEWFERDPIYGREGPVLQA